MLLRALTALTKLGSSSWPYLRLQSGHRQSVSMQVLGGCVLLAQWVKNLERVTGLHVTTIELAGWACIRVLNAENSWRRALVAAQSGPSAIASTTSLAASARANSTMPSSRVSRSAVPVFGSNKWQWAYVVLLTSHQLLWFTSEFEARPSGTIDLSTCSAVRQTRVFDAIEHDAGVDPDARCEVVEVRTMRGVRLQIQPTDMRNVRSSPSPVSDDSTTTAAENINLKKWHSRLVMALELCRKNAEAKRLISMQVSARSSRVDNLDESSSSSWARRTSESALMSFKSFMRGERRSLLLKNPSDSIIPEPTRYDQTPSVSIAPSTQSTSPSLMYRLLFACCVPRAPVAAQPVIGDASYRTAVASVRQGSRQPGQAPLLADDGAASSDSV